MRGAPGSGQWALCSSSGRAPPRTSAGSSTTSPLLLRSRVVILLRAAGPQRGRLDGGQGLSAQVCTRFVHGNQPLGLPLNGLSSSSRFQLSCTYSCLLRNQPGFWLRGPTVPLYRAQPEAGSRASGGALPPKAILFTRPGCEVRLAPTDGSAPAAGTLFSQGAGCQRLSCREARAPPRVPPPQGLCIQEGAPADRNERA